MIQYEGKSGEVEFALITLAVLLVPRSLKQALKAGTVGNAVLVDGVKLEMALGVGP